VQLLPPALTARMPRLQPRGPRFAHDSPLEERGFELVWGFPVSRGFFPRLAFDR
jgi:hypothetical protein